MAFGHRASNVLQDCPVSEGGKWRPRTAPSGLQQARQNRVSPETGQMELRNLSNAFFGHVLAWGLLIMACVLLNRGIRLEGSDPMTVREVAGIAGALFAASVLALVILARAFVRIHPRTGMAFVRNPARTYEFHLASVGSLTSSVWGFPKLVVAGAAIRLMGMEESTRQHMQGDRTTWLCSRLRSQPAAMPTFRSHFGA